MPPRVSYFFIPFHLEFAAKSTQARPVPTHREANFTPERMVVPRVHNTVRRFRAGTKFSLRWSNREDLDPGNEVGVTRTPISTPELFCARFRNTTHASTVLVSRLQFWYESSSRGPWETFT